MEDVPGFLERDGWGQEDKGYNLQLSKIECLIGIPLNAKRSIVFGMMKSPVGNYCNGIDFHFFVKFLKWLNTTLYYWAQQAISLRQHQQNNEREPNYSLPNSVVKTELGQADQARNRAMFWYQLLRLNCKY